MLSLHTNVAVLHIQPRLAQSQSDLSTATTRLGTGYRINSAKDDAAGLQIATRLEAQTRGMQVAIRNTQNARSLLQTADGAFDELGKILLRMKDLATQAADGSSTGVERGALQSEYDALGSELKNIVVRTTYGGDTLLAQPGAIGGGEGGKPSAGGEESVADIRRRMKELWDQALDVSLAEDKRAALWAQYDVLKGRLVDILFGGFGGGTEVIDGGKLSKAITFQIGATSGETMKLDLSKQLEAVDTAFRGISSLYAGTAAGAEVGTAADAGKQIDKINAALTSVGAIRSAIGAVENRLDHTHSNLLNMTGNTTDAQGRIMDTDYAAESATLASQHILVYASTTLLRQAAGMGRLVLALLR